MRVHAKFGVAKPCGFREEDHAVFHSLSIYAKTSGATNFLNSGLDSIAYTNPLLQNLHNKPRKHFSQPHRPEQQRWSWSTCGESTKGRLHNSHPNTNNLSNSSVVTLCRRYVLRCSPSRTRRRCLISPQGSQLYCREPVGIKAVSHRIQTFSLYFFIFSPFKRIGWC